MAKGIIIFHFDVQSFINNIQVEFLKLDKCYYTKNFPHWKKKILGPNNVK